MSHTHTYGFSPIYESPCFLSSLLVTNLFPQSWHRCGFSPVCIMLWTLRLLAWLKSMPDIAHTYRQLSPLQICEPGLSDSTRHCVHMKCVDSRFGFTSSHWWLTHRMFPATGWRIFFIILQQRKNSPILLQTNQQWKLVSNTAVVWENVQDNNCQLSVHRTSCLISTIIKRNFTISTSNAHLHSLHIFWNYNHGIKTAITFLHLKTFMFNILSHFCLL